MRFSLYPLHRRLACRRGFTLLEVMVAIFIFGIVVAAICSTLVLVLRATAIGRVAAARAQRQRVAMSTIEDSLMCVQSFQASPQYYSFIVENGDDPILSFAARLPAVFPRNGKFFNPDLGRDFKLRRVTFSLEPGVDRQYNLVLRQKPILTDMDPGEQSDPLILAQNVKSFTISCWDTNQSEWVTEWDNTNALPPMVMIGLALGGDNNDNNDNSSEADSQRTIVRAFSLPSSMMPTVVQLGAGGGGGIGQPGSLQLKVPGH